MKSHAHNPPVPASAGERKTVTGYVISILSLVVNLLLFALKYWVGLQTSSVAIIADAWHSLSDILTSVVVLIGFRIAAIPPDRKHPYGHGRAELIAALVVGMMLAVVAFNFLVESIHRLAIRQAASYSTLAIVVVAASVVIKEVMAQISIRAGVRTRSQSLIADGWHHRSDAFSSLIILLGILVAGRFWWTDGVLGMAVSALIFYATIEVLRGAMSPLLGEEPDEDLVVDIKEVASDMSSYDLQVHDMKLHEYGDHKELTLHIWLPADMRLADAHAIAHKLEMEIWKRLGVEATVHVDPLS